MEVPEAAFATRVYRAATERGVEPMDDQVLALTTYNFSVSFT
jgi:hypothetical protein